MSLICVVDEKATTTSCSKKGFEVGEETGQLVRGITEGFKGEDSPEIVDSFWRFLVGESTESGIKEVAKGRTKEACVDRGASSACSVEIWGVRFDAVARLAADVDVTGWLFTDEEADEPGVGWMVMLGSWDVGPSNSWKGRSAADS